MRYTTLLLLTLPFCAQAQNVGINATGAAPAASAILDVSSTTAGMLVPRMTAAQRTAIAAPATGLLVYQTDASGGIPANHFWFFDGTVWRPLFTDRTGWGLLGNAGTVAITNFLGTTDNVALRIRTNNTERFEFSTAGHLRAFNNGTAAAPVYSWNANTGTGLFQPLANALGFSTNAAERMRINAAGQVLVNTAAPTEPNQFEVRVATGTYWAINAYNATLNGGGSGFFHNTAVSGYNAVEGVTNGTNSGVWGWHNRTIGNGYGVRGTTANPVGAWAGFFEGDVGCTGLYYASDERFKRDIAAVDGGEALAKVMALAPRSYKYDAQRYPGMGFHPDRLSYGFIAQELKEVVPDLVMTKAIPDPTRSASARSEANNVEGYHMVNYIELIPILTKAIQEQQKTIEEQRERIEELNVRLRLIEEG